MTTKRRLAKLESEITAELQEQEVEESRRAAEFFRKCHLPLPAGATQSELDEVRTRLLALHAKVHAGTATAADEAGWFQWVDSIHSKYGSAPRT